MASTRTPPAGGPREDRRDVLIAGAGLALAAAAPAPAQGAPAGEVPLVPPRTEFVYEAVVDIAPTVPLGDSPLGERRIVPITGGTFEGPDIRGKVLPGGADRQLIRKDCVRRLDALYEMQAEDGSWSEGWVYKYGATGVLIGNQGLTTAMAAAAIRTHAEMAEAVPAGHHWY